MEKPSFLSPLVKPPKSPSLLLLEIFLIVSSLGMKLKSRKVLKSLAEITKLGLAHSFLDGIEKNIFLESLSVAVSSSRFFEGSLKFQACSLQRGVLF